MASFLVLAVAIVIVLSVAAQCFSLRTVRCAALISALVLVWFIVNYGIAHWGTTHPGAPPPNLADAFTAGVDAIVMALLRPLVGGGGAPPGLIGRIVIAVALAFGYRALESRARQRQAPQLNSARLSDDQPGGARVDADIAAEASSKYAQRHAQLTAELKFRLAAIDVRAPAILPGGSRVSGLASVAEASGVGAGGLAGAIIRFLGSVWPNPRQFRLRVWVEPQPETATDCKVTVYLENPRNGDTVATKTLAGQDIDEATSRVAGFVARQIFVNDPDTPPWCYGSADGSDLGALLLARQVRIQAESQQAVKDSRKAQIAKLYQPAGGGKAAGVARYELGQLLDLEGDHLGALCLHTRNLADFPRFYRGLYRLGMSLEMVAAPGQEFSDDAETRSQLDEILSILRREHYLAAERRGGAETGKDGRRRDDLTRRDVQQGKCVLAPSLRLDLLVAAARVLRTVRVQLTRAQVVLATLRYRDERRIWLPYWPWWLLGGRQAQRWAFHDGVRVAELLVAIRIRLIRHELGDTPAGDGALRRAMTLADENRKHYQGAVDDVCDIAGDGVVIAELLGLDKPRRRRGKRSSWQAAYNAACLYAALFRQGLASQEQVVACLRRTVDSPHSEMERPSDWIERDPDLSFLAMPAPDAPGEQGDPGERTAFKVFLDAQQNLDYPAAYPAATEAAASTDAQSRAAALSRVPGPRQALRYLPVAGDPLTDHIT